MDLNLRKEKKNHYIHLGVWAVIQIVIWNLPPVGELTAAGMHTLAAFVGLLYGLCFVKQYAIPCLAAPLLMTYSGAFPGGVTSAFAAGYGSTPFVMMISILLISGMVQYSGLAKFLALYMLNSKFTRGRPWTLTLVILATTTVLSLFIHPIVVIAIMLELVIDIFRGLNMKGNRWTLFLLLDIAVCGIQAQNVMPFQQGPTLMYGIMQGMNPSVNILAFGRYNMAVNAIITILLLLFCFVLTYLCCRGCVSAVKNYEPKRVEPMNEDQKIALGILIVYILIQLIPQFLPSSAIKTFLVTPEVVGYSSLFACVAMFIRKKDGSKFITIDQIAGNGFNWFTLLMLVGLGPCCDAMTSDSTGILTWLTNLVQPICSHLSPFMLLVFLAAFCIVATNFIDNIAVIFVIIPIVYVICEAMNVNPAAMLTAIIPCIQMGILVPGATPHVALVFAKEGTGYVSFGKICSWSLLRSAFVFLECIIIGYLMFGIFPNI